MLKARYGLHLAQELTADLVSALLREEDFDGDLVALSQVDSAPDLTHAATGQRREERERTDGDVRMLRSDFGS